MPRDASAPSFDEENPASIRIWWPADACGASGGTQELTGWAWERRGRGRLELVVSACSPPAGGRWRRSAQHGGGIPAGAAVLCEEGPVGLFCDDEADADAAAAAREGAADAGPSGAAAPLLWAVFVRRASSGAQPRLHALCVGGRAVLLPQHVITVSYEPGRAVKVEDAGSCFRALTCISHGYCPRDWADAPPPAAQRLWSARAAALQPPVSLRLPVWGLRLWVLTAAERLKEGRAAILPTLADVALGCALGWALHARSAEACDAATVAAKAMLHDWPMRGANWLSGAKPLGVKLHAPLALSLCDVVVAVSGWAARAGAAAAPLVPLAVDAVAAAGALGASAQLALFADAAVHVAALPIRLLWLGVDLWLRIQLRGIWNLYNRVILKRKDKDAGAEAMVVAVLLITPLLLLLPTLAAYALMLFVLWAPFVMLGQVSRLIPLLLLSIPADDSPTSAQL